jgi:hypothetical protein
MIVVVPAPNNDDDAVGAHSDHAFNRVGTVHVGWGVLEFDLFCHDEHFDLVGYLIVHFVEEGLIAPGRELGIHLCDGLEELFFGPIPNGHQPNGICIVQIKEDKVGVALVGCHREVPGIVARDLARDNVHCHEDMVYAHICWLLWHVVHVGVNMLDRSTIGVGLCGPGS